MGWGSEFNHQLELLLRPNSLSCRGYRNPHWFGKLVFYAHTSENLWYHAAG